MFYYITRLCDMGENSKIDFFQVTSLPLKSVNYGPSLLSKNHENAISQNGKSEKSFYAPFLNHMVVEFQKSRLPTLLHFVQVKQPHQPHVLNSNSIMHFICLTFVLG